MSAWNTVFKILNILPFGFIYFHIIFRKSRWCVIALTWSIQIHLPPPSFSCIIPQYRVFIIIIVNISNNICCIHIYIDAHFVGPWPNIIYIYIVRRYAFGIQHAQVPLRYCDQSSLRETKSCEKISSIGQLLHPFSPRRGN